MSKRPNNELEPTIGRTSEALAGPSVRPLAAQFGRSADARTGSPMRLSLLGLTVMLLLGCAARHRAHDLECPHPHTLVPGMTQQQVLSAPAFGEPVMFGLARFSGRPDADGIYAVAVKVGHSIPHDAPDVTWFYLRSSSDRTWVAVSFHQSSVTTVRCARLVRSNDLH